MNSEDLNSLKKCSLKETYDSLLEISDESKEILQNFRNAKNAGLYTIEYILTSYQEDPRHLLSMDKEDNEITNLMRIPITKVSIVLD